MVSINSPIDNVSPTTLVIELPVDKIIDSYAAEGYDVTRFFIGLDHIQIRKCTKTGYRFYYPFNIFGDERFYADIQKKSPEYYPEGKWEHKRAFNYINSGATVLEVGCATGYFMKMLQTKNCNCVGLELNNEALSVARADGLVVYNQMLDQHALSNQNKYDIVCSFQVVEHIADVNDYFMSALQCLKPNGKLIIGVPNSNPYLYRTDLYHAFNLPPHHAGLWNKETFKNVGLSYNLKCLNISIERLKDYKIWYLQQAKQMSVNSPTLGKIFSSIPRPAYKLTTALLSPFIEGRNILAVFEK